MMDFSFGTFLVIVALFSISQSSVSAHFFPNVSSIPPWLASRNLTAGAAAKWDAFSKFSGCRSGETVDGLSKLKKYFHYFGYLDQNSPTNFTDDFDDNLESALRIYQKNFNLNSTGELDDQTLAHLVKPRCGNPDIVNGTTTMNTNGKTNGVKFHTVAHFSFFPGRPRWPAGNSDLTFAFLPANQLSEDVKNVFRRAFTRWAAAIPLTFTETALYLSADIKIGFYSGDHGDGEPFDGVLGTLAHAFSPPSGIFHLDGDEDWVVAGDVTESMVLSAVDLESVAVHEIGHVLGLGHSSVENSIMYPTISSGTRKVELVGDDVEGIQSLYGANPDFNGTGASTSTPSTQSDTTDVYSDAGGVEGPTWFVAAAIVAVGSAVLML